MTRERRAAVDVVVPVFNAPDDVRRCVASVLEHTPRDASRVVLIDDASTDRGIAALFDELARRDLWNVVLLRNDANLGFTRTANRGIALSSNDVVLLNSDTIVTHGWLDALLRCAESDPRIATATPFSNNAEICSFPRFCEDNGWDGDDPEPVRAALARAAVPTYPDLPTGVGFCMFVRRAALDALGSLDVAFGAGYGEENDFCLRAARAGWRNVLVDDAFVVHVGERSFAGRKDDLGPRNLDLLRARHPHYEAMVAAYIAADPLRPLREAARAQLALREGLRGILHVIHHHGGGTEMHVRALIDASRERWRHYLVIAVGDRWMVEEHRRDGSLAVYAFTRAADEDWRDFVAGITATFDVALIHLHNVSGARDGLHAALAGGTLAFGYTLHDLSSACPTITLHDPAGRYCEGVTDVAQCTRCLRAQPAFAHVDIARWRAQHRELLDAASFVIAPSAFAASMLERYFPGHDVRVIPHGMRTGAVATPGARLGVVMPADGVPVVAVIGAIGPDKGARRVERLVALAREGAMAVRFVVIGYTDVERGPWQSDDRRLTVHGRYAPEDLPDLLAHYGASLVLFPSAGPETFSYTLSEAWSVGVPVLVPPIGALAERVASSRAGYVMTRDEWDDEARMLARVVALTSPGAAGERARVAAQARAMAQPSPQAMAEATSSVYAEALDRAHDPVPTPAFTARRVRDALGYETWKPPAPAASALIAEPDAAPARSVAPTIWHRVARRAVALRHTPLGRVLYRIAPAPLIDSLKARLEN